MQQNRSITGHIIEEYGDMLFRISIVMLKNHMDAEDAVQNTFVKYIEKRPDIQNDDHLKRWLARVCSNICLDMLRYRKKHSTLPADDIAGRYSLQESSGIFEALLKVEEKFRIVLALYYIEGYPINEIAMVIQRTPSAVKMRLHKGRKLLKEIYEKEML